jgi:hypothetical protein
VRLSASQQTGIKSRPALELLHDFPALLEDFVDSRAFLALELLVEELEDLFEPLDLLARQDWSTVAAMTQCRGSEGEHCAAIRNEDRIRAHCARPRPCGGRSASRHEVRHAM